MKEVNLNKDILQEATVQKGTNRNLAEIEYPNGKREKIPRHSIEDINKKFPLKGGDKVIIVLHKNIIEYIYGVKRNALNVIIYPNDTEYPMAIEAEKDPRSKVMLHPVEKHFQEKRKKI